MSDRDGVEPEERLGDDRGEPEQKRSPEVPPEERQVAHRRGRPSEGGGDRATRGRASVTRTRQEPQEIHEIWESQLAELLRLRRDGYSDAMSGAIGVAAALVPTCLETVVGYFSTPAVSITPLHLAELITFGISLGVAAVTWRVTSQRAAEAQRLANTIRGQSSR